ncbi:hypothetical protein Q7C36_022234 [Tachysurus vachellii]|uniref:Ig-like domain-containing protein n=1 Tax=Tachysurus vachellii TaxID=175792 RepID=A0AA88LPN6_TACVA|nr:hypothetical protein Q7C36_022234 [Tachysurus vachellii]
MYLTDVQNHFPLRLSDVKKTDEQMYYFIIRTNEGKERYLCKPGVTVSVTDLDLQIAPAEVTEGQSVVLTCKTTCNLTDPTFIWYKNSRNLITNTKKNNEVHLQSVSSEDAGSYSCAVRGYEHLHSPDQTLRVRYRPKNVSVSISPSGEIVEGSSVTLTCSSDANPPVQSYTWFKGKTSVGNEKTYNISKISSEDSGEYKSKSSNKVGHQDSNSVTLNLPCWPCWSETGLLQCTAGRSTYECNPSSANDPKCSCPACFQPAKVLHTTTLLRSLHWLPVAARIRFKTLMLAYKAKNGPAPSYLKALITPHTAPHTLRSTSTARLKLSLITQQYVQ